MVRYEYAELSSHGDRWWLATGRDGTAQDVGTGTRPHERMAVLNRLGADGWVVSLWSPAGWLLRREVP